MSFTHSTRNGNAYDEQHYRRDAQNSRSQQFHLNYNEQRSSGQPQQQQQQQQQQRERQKDEQQQSYQRDAYCQQSEPRSEPREEEQWFSRVELLAAINHTRHRMAENYALTIAPMQQSLQIFSGENKLLQIQSTDLQQRLANLDRVAADQSQKMQDLRQELASQTLKMQSLEDENVQGKNKLMRLKAEKEALVKQVSHYRNQRRDVDSDANSENLSKILSQKTAALIELQTKSEMQEKTIAQLRLELRQVNEEKKKAESTVSAVIAKAQQDRDRAYQSQQESRSHEDDLANKSIELSQRLQVVALREKTCSSKEAAVETDRVILREELSRVESLKEQLQNRDARLQECESILRQLAQHYKTEFTALIKTLDTGSSGETSSNSSIAAKKSTTSTSTTSVSRRIVNIDDDNNSDSQISIGSLKNRDDGNGDNNGDNDDNGDGEEENHRRKRRKRSETTRLANTQLLATPNLTKSGRSRKPPTFFGDAHRGKDFDRVIVEAQLADQDEMQKKQEKLEEEEKKKNEARTLGKEESALLAVLADVADGTMKK